MYIKIENDLYDIASRLKEIDEGYFILYNTKKKAYEIHNSEQGKNTYCLALPYPQLDARAVSLVKSTRREYIDNVLSDIERHNRKSEERAIADAKAQGEMVIDSFKRGMYYEN